MKKGLLLILPLFLTLAMFAEKGTDLIISEYVEGWSTNKAIEIYNPTDSIFDLSNYRITRYSNGGTPPIASAQWYVVLSGSLKPYQTKVFVLDKRDPEATGQDAPVWDELQARADTFVCPLYNDSYAMYFNGNDAVSLEKLDDTFIDIFGKIGENPGLAWTDTDPYSTGEGIELTKDHTLLRKTSIVTGVSTPIDKFNALAEWDSLPANTFTSLGWHDCVASPDSNQKPVFDSESYSFDLKITDPSGTVAGTVTATDPNGDGLKYFISKGNSYDPFKINRETGEISIAKTEELYWRDYTLGIDVTDGTAPVTKMVDITVEGGFTGINSLYKNLNIYPNPSINGYFKIVSEKAISEFEVYNLTGKLMLSRKIEGNGNSFEVRIEESKSGLYLLNLRFEDDSTVTRKLLVE